MENIIKLIYIFFPIFFITLMIYIMYKEKDIIKFNKLKLPKTKYLKGIYIMGLDYKSGNMCLFFDNDILGIGIENKDGIFYDKINDIKEIKINIKPYNYIKEVATSYEPNYNKTNGRSTGDFSYRNKVTVLKSYELNIITKDKNINLIVFKDPYSFFRR